MSDSTNNQPATKSPTHIAYHIRNREGGDSYWIRIGSAIGLIDGVANHRWQRLPHLWEMLAASISMAVAAIALAKIWKDNDRAD